MASTSFERTVGIGRVLGVCATVIGLCVACVPPVADAQESRPVEMSDFGVVPRPVLTQALVQSPAVQAELKITEAQKKQQDDFQEQRFEKIRQARIEIKDTDKFQQARQSIVDESASAQLAILNSEQRERLSQIQLQAQGPLAFSTSRLEDLIRFVGPPLSERLKLSDDQVKRVNLIANAGDEEITKAASFKVAWESKDRPTVESLRELVKGAEFRAAKQKTRRAAREAWDAVMKRIETLLSDDQRAKYRAALGKPFDLAKLNLDEGESETDVDIQTVTRALGFGGQRADPGFNTTVARPAFMNTHPRVEIDEAHNNFHTANGRYKPFADLMTNDGCLVSRNTAAITSQTLTRCDILVVANASAENARGNADGHKSAFTDDECAALQWWVWNGGSLLLITDHEPFGSASEALAQRFGVLMNTSGTVDPANDNPNSHGLVFSREKLLLLDHPITIGRDPSEQINRVATFYGQALIGPVGSTSFLRFADTATYQSATGPQSAAGWSQGLALSFGAGRAVVMGEAGELSAQLSGLQPMGMNVPGIDNRQMALNIIHWLAGELEPRETAPAPTAAVADWVPQRRRLLPRLFANSRAHRAVPAVGVLGW